MKNIFLFQVSMLICIQASAQQALKTYTGNYKMGLNEGTATYTYIEKNGERIMDGNFSFNCPADNFTLSGKYSQGKKTGVWTRKQTFSRYNGMAVVKSELRWDRVSESVPLKETVDNITETYKDDKNDGIRTKIRTVKNSWGYPAPGGSSAITYTMKQTYKSNILIALDCIKKEKEQKTMSMLGSYKDGYADGKWIFEDKKTFATYIFNKGGLLEYDVKEAGTGKILVSEKMNPDTTLAKEYFSDAPNQFNVIHGGYASELEDAKLTVKKINENLSIVKLCRIKKESIKLPNLNLNVFINAFGVDISPNTINNEQVLSLSPIIDCKVLSIEDTYPWNKIHFKDMASEMRFLKLVTNDKNYIFNINWEKTNRVFNGIYLYQLKAFLYRSDTAGFRQYKEFMAKNFILSWSKTPIPNGNYVRLESTEEYHRYILFLADVISGDSVKMKEFIHQIYNADANAKPWQKILKEQLMELRTVLPADSANIQMALKYVKIKENQVFEDNQKQLNSIKEIKIGDQIWMDKDLTLIPDNTAYQLIKDGKIQSQKTGEGTVLYGLSKYNNTICPEGWRLPSTADWQKLINNLGGDKEAAGKLMLAGGGSGFEATFPVFVNGEFWSKGSTYAGYLTLDAPDGYPFVFDFNSQGYYYTTFAPCRCIKK